MNRSQEPLSKDHNQETVPEARWTFPDARLLIPEEDFAGVGADLEPETLIAAYRSGYFPMPVQLRRRAQLGWFSPDPRGVLLPGTLKVSRSLRRSIRRYTFTINADFERVIRQCADPARDMGWIDTSITDAYLSLHQEGFAHSIETWDGDQLVGGLYGVSIGGLFAGESMFHRSTDASKVALFHLVQLLGEQEDTLLDVQWATDHLRTLGVIEIPRSQYLDRLRYACLRPQSRGFHDQQLEGRE